MIKAKMKSWSHSAKEKVGTKIRALKAHHRDVPAERAETERDHAAAGIAAAVEAMESSSAAPAAAGYPVQEATGAAVPPTSDSSEGLLPRLGHTAAHVGRGVAHTTVDIGKEALVQVADAATNITVDMDPVHVAVNVLGVALLFLP